jgi:hypothetical protein
VLELQDSVKKEEGGNRIHEKEQAQQLLEQSHLGQLSQGDLVNDPTKDQIQDLRMFLFNPELKLAGAYVKKRQNDTEYIFQFEYLEQLSDPLKRKNPMDNVQIHLPSYLIEDRLTDKEQLEKLMGIKLPVAASYHFPDSEK